MHAPLTEALPESVYSQAQASAHPESVYCPAQALALLGQAWPPASVYLGLVHPALVLRACVGRAKVLTVAAPRIVPVLDNTPAGC